MPQPKRTGDQAHDKDCQKQKRRRAKMRGALNTAAPCQDNEFHRANTLSLVLSREVPKPNAFVTNYFYFFSNLWKVVSMYATTGIIDPALRRRNIATLSCVIRA